MTITTTDHSPHKARLSSIARRQRGTRVRDAVFAACIALTAAVSIVTVSTASHVASAARVQQR